MKHEKLMEAIGQVDDRLIQEAEEVTTLSTAPNWRRWGALAASLAVVVGLGVFALHTLPQGNGDGAFSVADQATGESNVMQESAEGLPEQEPAPPDADGETDALPSLTVLGAGGQTWTVAGTATGNPASDAVTDRVAGSESDAQVAEDVEASAASQAGDTLHWGAEGTLTLRFGEETPMQVTACWYPLDGSQDGVETVVTDGVLRVPDTATAWLVTVCVQWTAEDWGSYTFFALPEDAGQE
jgi:hypothetical protein